MPASKKYFKADWIAVGRRVRTLRGFDMTQTELADVIGVRQSHISSIEKGTKEMGSVVLFRLAKFFGKSMEWILTGTDE